MLHLQAHQITALHDNNLQFKGFQDKPSYHYILERGAQGANLICDH